ncbi:MAG: hypothetical protein ACPG4T_04145 [Nannocystaceae bacterium]
MGIDQSQWRNIYKVFDPAARVEFKDTQALYVKRPGAVADEIANLDLDLEPMGKWVVCGAMGSGKSSELVHLAYLLQRDHNVIGLDLPRSVARVDRLQPAEVLYLLGLAAVRAANDANHPVPKKTQQLLHDAFKPLAASVEDATRATAEIAKGVALFAAAGASVAVDGGATATVTAGAAAGSAKGLSNIVRGAWKRSTGLGGTTRVAKEGDPDLEQLAIAVDEVLEHIHWNGRKPVILVDGLDKIQTLPEIRQLFSDSQLLARPQVPIIYTGPISLMLATEWQTAGANFQRKRLTNLVVTKPRLDHVSISPAFIADGREALRRVVATRLEASLDLSISSVFEGESLDCLIEHSGGLVRQLIQLVQYSVREALSQQASMIDNDCVQAAITALKKEFEITLNTKRVTELVHVANHGEPSGAEGSVDLLLRGYVLPYANGKVWYEPHPLLRGLRPKAGL